MNLAAAGRLLKKTIPSHGTMPISPALPTYIRGTPKYFERQSQRNNFGIAKRKMDSTLSNAQSTARKLFENGNEGATPSANGMHRRPHKNGISADIDAKVCG